MATALPPTGGAQTSNFLGVIGWSSWLAHRCEDVLNTVGMSTFFSPAVLKCQGHDGITNREKLFWKLGLVKLCGPGVLWFKVSHGVP